MVGGVRDVITCAKLQIEIFMGYDFTGGRIFDFPIDVCMGLTTVPIDKHSKRGTLPNPKLKVELRCNDRHLENRYTIITPLSIVRFV